MSRSEHTSGHPPKAITQGTFALLLAFLVACDDSTGPGGGLVLESVSPMEIETEAAATPLVVTGRGFTENSVIRLSGTDSETQMASPTTLQTVLAPEQLVEARTLRVTVFDPAKDESSEAVQVVVRNPAPLVGTAIPDQIRVGSQSTSVQVFGDFFRGSSVVRWNGEDRPTTFNSDQTLIVELLAEDLATAGNHTLAIFTPGPGGGLAERAYVVHNPKPHIEALAPNQATAGDAAFTLEVQGAGFVPGASVRWNGAPAPTTYIGADLITAEIPAESLETAGEAVVSVVNPAPALAAGNEKAFVVRPAGRFLLELQVIDLAWDPVGARLFASVADTDPTYPNVVVMVDPTDGQIIGTLGPGSMPGRLAIADDASVLYVALNGEAAIARVDLATLQTDLTFPVGVEDSGELLFAEDIDVMPGAPGTVAVSRMNPLVHPHGRGVAIYDDGVMRPAVTTVFDRVNEIEFAAPDVLYGHENESTSFMLQRMAVVDNGVVVDDELRDVVQIFYGDLKYGDGYLYFNTGEVVDAAINWPAATLSVNGVPEPEPRGGRVYFFGAQTLHAFDTATWLRLGEEPIAASPTGAWRLVRWGTDGFAVSSASQLLMFRNALAAP